MPNKSLPSIPTEYLALPWDQTGLVVVAAGSGARFGGFKQLAAVEGKPLLLHALSRLMAIPFARRVVVLPDQFFDDHIWEPLQRRYPEAGAYTGVHGGDQRAQSVLAGIRALGPECRYVAVHDGARPFPPLVATARCLEWLEDHRDMGAAIVSSRVTDTIKRMESSTPLDGPIERTENRDRLRRAETPQLARRNLLEAALANPAGAAARDEAEAMERAGHGTASLLHDGLNLKVTVPFDLILAGAWLRHEQFPLKEATR